MSNTTVYQTFIATNGRGQHHDDPVYDAHVWQTGEYGGAIVNHIRSLSFESITSYSYGHHIRSGDGNDTFNFVNLSNVQDTVVGRLEDFDPTRDTIQIEGVTLDFNNLPPNVRIVRYNGDHNDPNALPQQWLLIDTGGGHIFYALEGARFDKNGDGGSNSGNHESHFIETAPNFSSLPDVQYVNPFNFIPAGFAPQGGVVINDYKVGGNPIEWGDWTSEDVNTPITGTEEGDLIAGGLNDDIIHAGGGNDRVWGGDGNDLIHGDAGNDTLWGNAGNDTIFGGAGNDHMNGGAGDDLLWGGAGHDNLIGGGGNDRLYGQGGNDSLDGGYGNDTLVGGMGNDTLTGGVGADVFVFSGDFGNDVITDFDVNLTGERINLSGVQTITSFGDLISNHASQVGSDVLIDALNGNSILLRNVQLSTLSESDFVF